MGANPLAVGSARFAALLEPFEPLRRAGRVQHKVQTGATLITDEWCEPIERYEIGVGVSIDGPRSANHHRVNRVGRRPLDQAQRFWRDTFLWCQHNRDVTVREVDKLLGFLGLEPASRAADARHDLIPTVGWNGDVVLLSPELLGVQDDRYRDFVAGNVLADPLPTILRRAADLAYVQEFLVGLERCKATCEFFAYCQGAHAGDRYFEHGTFTATETEHCKTSVQAPVLALAELMNSENGEESG